MDDVNHHGWCEQVNQDDVNHFKAQYEPLSKTIWTNQNNFEKFTNESIKIRHSV